MADEDRAEAIRSSAKTWRSLDLTARQLCDLELLLNGGFSPLQGFMNRVEYEAVCKTMRLPDGGIWSIPITLDVAEEVAKDLKPGEPVALRTPEGFLVAVLHVGDVWQPDRASEAMSVFGTEDRKHPGVARLMSDSHECYVGGRLEGVELPRHFDYRARRNRARTSCSSHRPGGRRPST